MSWKWKWCWSWWRSGDDVVNGTSGRDWIFTGRGDDTINAYGGNDIVFAGSGDDEVHAGDGCDRVFGGCGDDTIYGGAGKDRIWGGKGDDTIHGGDHADKIWGGSGDDSLYGDGGNDYVHGGSGDDHIEGGLGCDKLKGGSGYDTIHGGDHSDRIYGGSGGDSLYGDDGNDYVHGGSGDDTAYGGAGNDKVKGGSGDDTVHGDDGNDYVHGGSGDDSVYGGAGNDKVKGGSGDDHVDGGAGSDRVYAGSGDDIGYFDVSENDGAWNYYHGGSGHDHLVFKMTQDEYDAAETEFEEYDAHLAAGHAGRSFKFDSMNLKVKSWEEYYVEITDEDCGLTANDDSIVVAGPTIDEAEENDGNPTPQSGSSQTIGRDAFRFGPNPNVGNELLPWVSIKGIVDLNDIDWYRFDLRAGEKLILDIDETNSEGFLADDKLNSLLIVQNEAGGPNPPVREGFGNPSPSVEGGGSSSIMDAYLEFPVTENGFYYVGVRAFFETTQSGPYTLNVSIENPQENLGAYRFTAEQLLNNDQAADVSALTITEVTNAVGGTAVLIGDEVFFTPDLATGPRSFDYTVSDDGGVTTSTATATIDDSALSGDVVSTSGDETLIGRIGVADRFNFSGPSGDDTIPMVFDPATNPDMLVPGFDLGLDALVLDPGQSATFEESDGNTLVTFDSGGTVLLEGVTGVTSINDLLG